MRRLGYQEARDSNTVGLLDRPTPEGWHLFTALNSLRDVEPTVGPDPAGRRALRRREEALTGGRRRVPPRQPKRTRVGELRPSALIHTFGVGAVVDLPRMSAVVMGLDDWRLDDAPVIEESRLLAKIREQEGLEHVERLHGPPQTEDRGGLASRASTHGT